MAGLLQPGARKDSEQREVPAKSGICLAALALSLLAFLLLPRAPPADLEFCPPGEGAGQCGAPSGTQRGLAADTAEGLLYVADQANTAPTSSKSTNPAKR